MTLLTLAHGLKALLQLKAAWGVWAGNSNATTTEGAAAADAVLGVWPNNSNATATEGAAAAEFGVGLKVLLQLNAAWGVWPNNSNATTACSAWDGLTCRPKGLVVAL
ncbi:unnamed protein product [Closterium sp. NIES-64]|nr:unnamed protein product [Closterium sp. NIES-64]